MLRPIAEQLALWSDVWRLHRRLDELTSPSAARRAKACQRLHAVADKRAVCALLGCLGDERSIPALTDALEDPEPEVRQAASEALAALGEASLDALLAGALHWLSYVRAAACGGLERLDDRRATEALIRLLADPAALVRTEAGQVLRARGEDATVTACERLLAGDSEALPALQRLVEAGEVRVLEPLARAYEGADPPLRATLAEAFEAVGFPATDGLQQRLRDPSAETRHASALALRALAHALRPVLPGLVCPACFVRFEERAEQADDVVAPLLVCRACERAGSPLRGVDSVVAVLDAAAESLVRTDAEARVNALRHLEPFDVDRVEILDATDREVERFCIAVGNDTDRVRRARCRSISCVVSTDCELSPATLRMLEQAFGEVRRGPLKGQHSQRRIET